MELTSEGRNEQPARPLSDKRKRQSCVPTLLLAALIAFFSSAPLPVPAQTSPDTPAIAEPAAKAEPYLDRKVGSTLEQFSRWKARMKKEHFTRYLVVYTALLAGLTGLVFGFLAYRLADPMSPYRFIKSRTLLLSIAVGGALGIVVAVMQVPPNTAGKVSLLLIATGTGAANSLVGTWFSFIIMRLRSNHLARRDGRRITDRMRHA